MDLGTVRDRLLANQFTSHQAVLDDIQLIWDNCKLYNVDGSVSQIIRIYSNLKFFHFLAYLQISSKMRKTDKKANREII